MDALHLSQQFLKTVDELVAAHDGKWRFTEFRTSRGLQSRTGFLDACSELFVVFTGQSPPVIYRAICEALRQRGRDAQVQRYGGMVLLNLVRDAYGQVDELIDIAAPVFDLSNGEIPAFLVEQIGIDALVQKIECRKSMETRSDILTRLNGMLYQAQVYQNWMSR